jgi:hypothetical protein
MVRSTVLAQVQMSEAERDGDPTLLLFRQAIEVDPGECADHAGLAVVDVTCGTDNQRSVGHGAIGS